MEELIVQLYETVSVVLGTAILSIAFIAVYVRDYIKNPIKVEDHKEEFDKINNSLVELKEKIQEESENTTELIELIIDIEELLESINLVPIVKLEDSLFNLVQTKLKGLNLSGDTETKKNFIRSKVLDSMSELNIKDLQIEVIPSDSCAFRLKLFRNNLEVLNKIIFPV